MPDEIDIGAMPVPAAAPRPLSQVLGELAARAGPRVSLGDVAAGLWDRGFAPLLVVFAAPNLIPLLPGTSTVLALPLVLLAAQLLWGRPTVWLPRFLRRRSVERADFDAAMLRLAPLLRRFERLARPRLWPASRRLAERLAGAAVLVMATIMLLPIPFANSLPAVAVMAIALALSQRDGLWFGAGLALSAASLALAAGVVGAAGVLGLEAARHWPG